DKGDLRVPGHVDVDVVGDDGHVRDAARAGQTHERALVVAADGDVVEVALRVDLCRAKELGRRDAGQYIGGGPYEAIAHERLAQPQVFDAGEAHRRPVLTQRLSDGGGEAQVRGVGQLGKQVACHDKRRRQPLRDDLAVLKLAR